MIACWIVSENKYDNIMHSFDHAFMNLKLYKYNAFDIFDL